MNPGVLQNEHIFANMLPGNCSSSLRDSAYQETFIPLTFPIGVLNSRIVLFRCHRLAVLSAVLRDFQDLRDILAYKPLAIRNETVLAVGWFEAQKMPEHIRQLQLLFGNVTAEALEPCFITDPTTLAAVVSHHEFRYLEDSYATVYVLCDGEIIMNRFRDQLAKYLGKFGVITSFETIPHLRNTFRCTFDDIRASFKARAVPKFYIDNASIYVRPSLEELSEKPAVRDIKSQPNLQVINWMTGDIKYAQTELTEQNNDEWKKCQHLKSRRPLSGSFGTSYVPHENQIDITRIRLGQDPRKTIMIRNVPNKINHNELKEFIDLTSKNLYDFLYLRIDFENHCNVGYAFISFVEPRHIIKFYLERAGKKWNKFNSEKVCEMSYAKVQGKAKLIDKFRNSKIMGEHPGYRPRLYHTDGPLKGAEIKFPPPTKRGALLDD
ncbi:hypothetical protein KL918_003497 [Ogataea parapolymorpha]|uniref:Mei2-like C-terminal RNA recognition motif domain-containing protein n=1 Tax=Ogataea parapolymorpha (strain ATCC 26012 / BCRC 20466 / JCM 22074 / NRRL Y-7560 / DL-1) TaxID=871575 RepID=W1Q7J1_OGAPD|nr:hypothetical protein HPODL_02581 [Ogataea parapolymorpha DL-1]ESW95937.1 hypothetical protein HPODL_02581 [Ogataea parapolymorpha DL-1]KAG7866600.1 hypothetical protein KL918_003497 [Ogataea parapolymorpha]KAG7871135.1 hypothetical protein KL916_004323 [Ogataea parapolymorpha]